MVKMETRIEGVDCRQENFSRIKNEDSQRECEWWLGGRDGKRILEAGSVYGFKVFDLKQGLERQSMALLERMQGLEPRNRGCDWTQILKIRIGSDH